MAIVTSEMHPIPVTWLEAAPPGRLGITYAPGKCVHTSLISGARWERDLGADLERLKHDLEVDTLVCLLEEHELGLLEIPDYLSAVPAYGMEVLRLPIPDGSVPSELGAARNVVEGIVERLRDGKNVVVHCRGGLGRSGVIAGCVLVALGCSGDEALERLRKHHPEKCPETSEQRAFVRRYGLGASQG